MFVWCKERKERKTWEKAYKIKATMRSLMFRWYLSRVSIRDGDPEEIEINKYFMKLMLRRLADLVGFKKADILLDRIFEGSKECE